MEVFWYCRYWFYVEIFITAGVHLSVSGHSHEYWSIGAIIKFFRNSIAFYTIVFNSCCFSRAENNKVKRKLYGLNEYKILTDLYSSQSLLLRLASMNNDKFIIHEVLI